MTSSSLSTTVANGGPFQVSMEHENLCIISIPTESIPTFAWWLFREYSLDRRNKNCFHSILMDDDGLSLICSTASTSTLESINGRGLVISPQRWRAFVINVVGSAVEFPGAVHYLADSLSQEGLSILHISTFESEVFLVQEQDIEKACTVFRKSESPIEIASLIQEAQRKRTLSGNATSSILHNAETLENNIDHIDSFYVGDTDISVVPPFKDGFELCVLPGHVMLCKLNDDFPLMECSAILTKLLLYDERYSPLERMVSKGIPLPKSSMPSSGSIQGGLGPAGSGLGSGLGPVGSNGSLLGVGSETMSLVSRSRSTSEASDSISRDRNSFMWGLWQCENELTFLLDESDVDSFPEGALTVSPQRWRLIKLGGRQIEFDETGIVTAMSKIDSSIPSLNISTATTNCTLVPEELLEQTLDCLSESLKCPVREYR